MRPGGGLGGADRVEVIWAAGAITNKWLEVLVEGNDAAGVPATFQWVVQP